MPKRHIDNKPDPIRRSDERAQQATSRVGATASDDPRALEREGELLRQAQQRARDDVDRMRRDGFGDHKGVEGF
jgi:hypothetical protein